MKSRLYDLNAWQIVFAVARTGSMNRAAALLESEVSTVSRTVSGLEADLGCKIFRRDKSCCILTKDGEVFVNELAPLAARFTARVTSLIKTDSAGGKVFVSLPSGLGQPFMRWFAEFQTQYPKIKVEVHTSNALFEDEQIDIAILAKKYRIDGNSSFVELGDLETGAFASEAYLAAHGAPESIADLEKHRLITNSSWACPSFLYDSCGNAHAHGAGGSLRVDSMNLLISSVLDDLGIGLGLPVVMTNPFTKSGQMVRILPELQNASLKILMAKPKEAHTSKAACALADFIEKKWAEEQEGTAKEAAFCCSLA
jgi:DNA-binding transcriptional LysR family regulator